ncbi:MAG: hypothetical protein HY926_03950 [Elusimicrobia bacterium]|nr:hypothetical protein [Elusimicrobiota bacterium]
MKALAMLWMALLAAAPALQAAAVVVDDGNTDEIREEVSHLKDAVGDYGRTDAEVVRMAHDLFGRMPSARIVVHANLRGWDREPTPPAAPADAARRVESADKRLAYYDKDVPAPMAKAMDYARRMQKDGRADFDQERKLSDDEMGVYNYLINVAQLGTIRMNQALSFLTTQIGDAIIYATLIHEAAHARDHQDGKLNGKDVLDGEVLAFQAQYQWLKVADPYDERICYLRTAFMTTQKENPSRLGAIGLQYLNHLAELQATKGDAKAIREMAVRLGYRDGDEHRHGGKTSA